MPLPIDARTINERKADAIESKKLHDERQSQDKQNKLHEAQTLYAEKCLRFPALIKAIDDHYSYSIGLRSGDVIFFERVADFDAHIVVLDIEGSEGASPVFDDEEANAHLPHPRSNRGVEVRISDIMWAQDTPT